jgi:hypothetical protein
LKKQFDKLREPIHTTIMSKTNSAVETKWGTVEKDEDGLFLGADLVIELGEGGFYMVLAVAGTYVARWVDEDGTAHEKTYKSRNAALECARTLWGA